MIKTLFATALSAESIIASVACALSLVCLIVLLVLLKREKKAEPSNLSETLQEENDRLRQYIAGSVKNLEESNRREFEVLSATERERLESLERRIEAQTKSNEMRLAEMRVTIDEKMNRMTEETAKRLSESREAQDLRMGEMRRTLDEKVNRIVEENNRQLSEMREVVDEKLNKTLEIRLNKSFEIINDRLEAVYKGLGDMQNLAKGVGDLKNVLSNVKMRGTWAEMQLDSLLSQMLTNEQYEKNVRIDPLSDERVDFVIRLPGKEKNEEVLLPLDSKFPIEEYQRLVTASETGDVAAIEACGKRLETVLKEQAKKIRAKYVMPPKTCDFALLYVPVEGLYAEIVRRDGLCESLQREFRIVVCGPSTLAALLNSLQMGFKTVAIEKRSAELWQLLSTFKGEFIKFTELLEKTRKKLAEAANSIDTAAAKTRTIGRKLKDVALLDEGTEEF